MSGGGEAGAGREEPRRSGAGGKKKATRKRAKSPARKAGAKKTTARKGTRKAAPAARGVPAEPPAPEFAPTVGEADLQRFAEGRHPGVHELLGAHVRTLDGVAGTSFAVWAPAARRVSVVGDFCDWDGARWPLRPLGTSGVHERFVPGVGDGALYKFEIETSSGERLLKSDPYGRAAEPPPGHASRVVAPSTHAWGDADWLAARAGRDVLREPLSVYEVHLGSWARIPEDGNRSLGYREIAPALVERARELGFTHVELMPVMEHPFGGSWGYQVTGYFAPTSRYGTPDDLRFLIDTLHRAGIGVLLDWVPAHFPGDEHALARFDGTPLYEHEDPRKGKHPDWDTLIFNYGRHEVANMLLANALYWIEEFHVDGLRVDAVASMLYLDYSREAGEWVPNELGGRENLEAVDFIRRLTTTVRERAPGCLMIAEESTSWPGVTKPVTDGGLGFHLKWNLGWMHETLRYFSTDPLFRPHVHEAITFPVMFEHTEHFLMPLSHDEVVHGKGSLFGKMHGDTWQKLANLRTLLTYQYTRPGKKLLFMGTEVASAREWDHDTSLDWHLGEEPGRQGLRRFLGALGHLYRATPALWRDDESADGFTWIDCEDKEQSVFSYERRSGDERAVVVLNMTPLGREGYRIGAPVAGRWRELLSSDAPEFGGSGGSTPKELETEAVACHGREQSLVLSLPPLGALVLAPAPPASTPPEASRAAETGREPAAPAAPKKAARRKRRSRER